MKKKKSTTKSKNETTAKNLESRFDENASILDYFDVDTKIRRINLDIPEWAIVELDKEAQRRGVTRQSLIKNWLIDRIDQSSKKVG